MRDGAERTGLLLGLAQREVLALVVEGLAGPQGFHDLECLLEPFHPDPRLGRADAEGLELAGHRSPADAELEPATGGVVEGDRLAGQHGRVPERIAQHEGPDLQPLGPGGEPGVGDHGVEHGRRLGQGWRQMVHAGHAAESRLLGGPRPVHQLIHAEAHLGEEHPELEGGGHGSQRLRAIGGGTGTRPPTKRTVAVSSARREGGRCRCPVVVKVHGLRADTPSCDAQTSCRAPRSCCALRRLATLHTTQCSGEKTCENATAMYEGTWESVRNHRVPVWYDDAKLGVFLHWGLYSVPGWAPRVPDIQELLVKDGPKRMLRENPYAEWYLNTMQIEGSPTQLHHLEVYGDDYPYERLRQDVQRRLGRGQPRRRRRPLSGRRRPLRRAHDQTPRRLRPVALGRPAPDQGGVPRRA